MTKDNTPPPISAKANQTVTTTPGRAYIVGGAVRDALLGIQSKDKDWVVVGATPEQMASAGFQQVGADFPVFLHPDTKDEYALARTERKQGRGYKGFICDAGQHVTLEQDLERRDLTINSMAQSSDGQIVDPYDGQQDLAKKILRHTSNAFIEDPLRVLRVARFAARFSHLGFHIAAKTKTLMKSMVEQGELNDLTPERVWQETQRALTEASPRVYFDTLRDCGALKVLMPELDALFGVPQPEKYHPEIDTGIHAFMSLESACQLSDSVDVRFAALVHDLGKALTPKKFWPSHHGHESSGLKPVKALCQRLRVSNHVTRLSLLACEFHTHVHRAFELKPSTLLKVLKSCDAMRNSTLLDAFLLVCTADARGRTGFESSPYPQADYVKQAMLEIQKVDTQALIKQEFQGKALGEAIDRERVRLISALKASTPKP